jgi:hypothetical protein
LIEVPIGVDVGPLHYVFHVAIVAQDGANGAIQPLVVAADQNLVQRRLAVADAIDDGFVGQFVGGKFWQQCWFQFVSPHFLRVQLPAFGSPGRPGADPRDCNC